MSQTTKWDLESMRSVDIRTVDPTTLEDIRNVVVDSDKPHVERMTDFIRQIRNPYCFRCGDMVVKVGYSNTAATMEERMESFFRAL